MQGLDIGPKSIDLVIKAVCDAKTIIWNGPMGVFEFDKFAHGTFAVANALAQKKGMDASWRYWAQWSRWQCKARLVAITNPARSSKSPGNAITIIGGGDSVAAVEKAGVASAMSHISTGGGASLELLEGKTLPGTFVMLDEGSSS